VTEEYFSKNDENSLDVNEYLADIPDNIPENITNLSVEISVNKEGFLQTNSTEFYELITTHKIEARRIRNCVICPKIFWANRIDKWTCSKTCGNTLRQRCWQMENKNEYNEKRRKNYAYKQNMKNQREKKNGNLQTR
jgi:hypothetical protein